MKQLVSSTNLRTEVESVDTRKLQPTQQSVAIAQLPPKGHEAECHLDGFPFGRDPSEKDPSKDPLDVRIRERDALAEREARDRPGGVGADAR